MAIESTTLYKFKANLTELKDLNVQLEKAKANLMGLKKGNEQYASQAKKINGLSRAYDNQNKKLRKLQSTSKSLTASGRNMVSIFKSASIAIASAFAFRAIIGGIRGVITSFADFEQQMAAVRAISGATDEQFKELEKTARDLGSTTVFTATQVGKLQEEYARLGFTTEEIVAAQAATLDLAAATGEDLARAAGVAGSIIRSFGFDADMITRVTNVMGAAFTGSALNLERFTQSMKFVAPIAKTAGFTFEETSSMLMTLADAGLHGSIAGNALKNIFLKLGDSNSKLNKHLGVTVHGMPQLLEEMRKLKDETFGLTEATDLLDKRSAPAFLVLLRNIEELDIARETLNEAEGDITRMAAIRLDTLTGDFKLLTSATEGLGIAIGETFSGGLRRSVYAMSQWVSSLSQSNRTMKKLEAVVQIFISTLAFMVVRLAVLRATTLLTGKSFISLSLATKTMKYSFGTATQQAAALRLGLQMLKRTLTALAGAVGIGLVIYALTELVMWYNSTTKASQEATFATNRIHESFRKEIKLISELNVLSKERHDLLREFAATHGNLLDGIDVEIQSKEKLAILEGAVKGVQGINKQVVESQERVKQNDEELANKLNNFEKEKDAIIKLNKVQRRLRGGKDGSIVLFSVEEQLKEQEDLMRNAIAGNKEQLEIEEKFQKDKKAQMKQGVDDIAEAAGIEINVKSSMRDDLRKSYGEQLEDFRKFSFDLKTSEKLRHESNLEAMEKAAELAEEKVLLDEQVADKSILANDKAFGILQERVDKEGPLVKSFYKDYQESQEQVNLTISQYKSFVKDLQVVLADSGKTYDDESALSTFRLQKTKDFLKDMLKAEKDAILDTFEARRKAAANSLKLKELEIGKTQDLIKANLGSIKEMQSDSDTELIRAEIKDNAKNYDVLKNMSRNQFNDLMTEKSNNRADLLVVLQAMYDEELAKTEVNEKALLALKAKYNKLLKKIDDDQATELSKLQLDQRKAELKNLNQSLFHFGSYLKEKRAVANQEHANELADLTRQLKAKQITQEKFDALSKKSKEKLDAEESKIDQEKIAKFAAVYSQISAMVMEHSANIAAFRIQELNEEFDQTRSDEEAAFSERLRLAELHGQDTEGMQQTHDDKMTAMEERKDLAVREIKRKQFLLDKANSIAMALINGYQAITKVSGQLGVAAIVGAPIMAALIAAQVGMIAAQKFVGQKGGITPGNRSEGTLEKFANGGMVTGKSHAEGGEKFQAGGRVVELEGGEAVINKRSTALFKGQLSEMNSFKGYGNKFEQGGVTPGTQSLLNAQTWSGSDIAGLIANAINSQTVLVSEGAISSSQSSVNMVENQSTVFM